MHRDDDEPPPVLFAEPGPLSRQVASSFEPARLTQARVLAGRTRAELASTVGVSAAAVGQYEAGVNAPRPDVLARIGKELSMPMEYFAFGRPLVRLDDMNTHFRRLRSAKVGDRQLALATAAQVWELTFALERHVRLPDADLPALELHESSPVEAAKRLREHWGVGQGPVRHLVATAEARGVVVAIRPVGAIEAVDAFSVVVLDRPIVVTTPRRAENVYRHRFSLAHELGHILIHQNVEGHNHEVEREADQFAAEFLTPAAAMEEALPSRLDLVDLNRIGQVWGVSTESLVKRMVERRRTTESSARRAFQRLAATQHLRQPEPTSSYRGEQPTLLRAALELAEQHGAGIPTLAQVLHWPASRIRDLLGIDDARPILRLVRP